MTTARRRTRYPGALQSKLLPGANPTVELAVDYPSALRLAYVVGFPPSPHSPHDQRLKRLVGQANRCQEAEHRERRGPVPELQQILFGETARA